MSWSGTKVAISPRSASIVYIQYVYICLCVCVKYLFFSRMILLKHVTPLLRTFPDFSSHVEDFLAGLPQPADSSALRPCGSLDFTPHPFPRPLCSSSGLGAGPHMLQAPTSVPWPPLCPLPGALFPRNLPPTLCWIPLQCYPFTEPPLPEPPPCFPFSSMMNIHLLVGCKLPREP